MQPTRWSAALFAAKVFALQWRRRIKDPHGRGIKTPQRQTAFATAGVQGLSITPLWTSTSVAEFRLTAGKIENLRIAVSAIDGLAVVPGEIFSFWRALGRPTGAKGYVEDANEAHEQCEVGREIREGCVVPSVAGGLCQLSNALYDAALKAGFDIVERHAHTRIVAGSLAEAGRDATVFWNYVDLRFRSPTGLRIEAEMTAADLIIKLKAPSATATVDGAVKNAKFTLAAASCETCGVHSCFRHQDLHGASGLEGRITAKAAFLVDAASPEAAKWVETEASSLKKAGLAVELMVPLDGMRRGKANYSWPTAGFDAVRECVWASFKRSRVMRRFARRGAERQMALLAQDAMLARAYAKRLSLEVTHLVIAQNLLLPLFDAGVLGGRTFDVLMTRLPFGKLQATLDRAARLLPESPTLADFRVPAADVEREAKALSLARRLITPHAEIARAFPERGVRIAWAMPPATRRGQTTRREERTAIVFAGPTAGRKGAHAVRDAARTLGLEVLVVGEAAAAESPEGDAFWGDVAVSFVGRDAGSITAAFERSFACVAPAVIETAPRVALSALAHGVPVIGSAALGLDIEALAGAEAPFILIPHAGERLTEDVKNQLEAGAALTKALERLAPHIVQTQRVL